MTMTLDELARRLDRLERERRRLSIWFGVSVFAALSGWVTVGLGRSSAPSKIELRDGQGTAVLSSTGLRFETSEGKQLRLDVLPTPHLELTDGAPMLYLGISAMSGKGLGAPYGYLSLSAKAGGDNYITPIPTTATPDAPVRP